MRWTTLPIFAFSALAVLATACGEDKSNGGGGDDSTACIVASSGCVDDCIPDMCGQSISDCSGDPMCDAAKDTMVSCACDAQKVDDVDAVGACLSDFTNNGGFLSTAFADCATTNCASDCGL